MVVYNIDRLTRSPKELEALIELFDRLGLTDLATATGDFDFGSDQGLFVARIMSAVAAQESDRKSARLQRKMRERAERGLPGSSGGRRAYGWQEDRITLIRTEAEIIKQLARRYLAGESVTSLANWMNDENLPTVTGGQWGMATIRTMLANPRLAGQRTHRGQIVARGVWEPIITDEQHRQIVALMQTRKVNQVRSPRRALLSRTLRCALCGSVMFSGGSQNGSRRYVCQADPGRTGCGRMSIKAEPLEEIVVEAVLTRLDSPEFAAALARATQTNETVSTVAKALAKDQEQMEELAQMWSGREISTAEWKAAREPIEARIRTAERRLASETGSIPVEGLAGHGSALREQWSGLNLTRQHAIVTTIIDTITIHPAKAQGSRDYLSRVEPVWRL